MCGRFTLTFDVQEAIREFGIDEVLKKYQTSFNYAPSQDIPVIFMKDNKKFLDLNKWGIPGNNHNVINAKAETMDYIFKGMERCLIPADGFFEWKNKIPFYIQKADKKPFAFAGIKTAKSCVIVTVPPSKDIEHIHDRMPVILKDNERDEWLKHNIKAKTYEENLIFHQVSDFVNNPKNNSEKCIASVRSIGEWL